MRRFVLRQVVVTLVAALVFLGALTIFATWGEPRYARILALGTSTLALYLATFFLWLHVKNREWDRPFGVAFAAAAIVTIALTGGVGTLAAILALSVGSVVVAIRSRKEFPAGDRRMSWEHPSVLLWVQFLVTLVILGRLALS